MQYVRSISGSLSSTWNSINPATLSGAIDVIVVEQEDGSLACSPFHIRFGKFSLLRPYEKKVEFKVNGRRVDYPMKLGEGGEAFFVFETQGSVPEGLQTSPLVSPATSPAVSPALKGREGQAGEQVTVPSLQEPEPFDLEKPEAQSDDGRLLPTSSLASDPIKRPIPIDFARAKPSLVPKLERTATDSQLPSAKAAISSSFGSSEPLPTSRPSSPLRTRTDLSSTPPPHSTEEARIRALNLSKKLWTSNISNQVTESGDLMLDMTGFKSSDGEALHAEVIARQLLSEEIDGPYDIGALIGADEKGNIWIYSSEEAKEAANRHATDGFGAFKTSAYTSSDAISDPGYHSDDARSDSNVSLNTHIRRDSDSAVGMNSQPSSPSTDATSTSSMPTAGDPNKNYAKTLRLTSEQLEAMDLRPGANNMAFTVNRATCQATLWRWHHATPIVISDIDGTITKSDVLGHVLNAVGRDWTHQGVAKLYTEIAANGYNFLYLTSRSVGQADTTRAYLDGVVQEGGYRLPKGPVILSPDRTIAALRREIYLRKPEIFKMACLRDIMALFTGHGAGSPFYAGFGNRLTDALSYRSVNIPSTRIFTINSNSEVSLDLLSLNKYKTAYGSMREIVDHYFPPVGLLVKGGGEDFTDFSYWRDRPLDVDEFTDSESEDENPAAASVAQRLLQRVETAATDAKESVMSEDEAVDGMLESYMSDPRLSLEDSVPEYEAEEEEEEEEEEEDEDALTSSMLEQEEDEDGDDELDVDEEDNDELAPTMSEGLEGGKGLANSRFERTPRQGGTVRLGLSVADQEEELD
ncbi:hypothetical protein BAUCODRAFT_65912 [Baudoinia panamericana UAMH 10762]|uniref:LNS2/PITP domain-containing protein n=1 Tax=Baudoinia panamericana (strain UAMH 10762) TaxID=717646 RepID=M2MPN7_BAUPA|nr:uncharacterized protein BAUCODRAFT_65912 [Baudoinia panamericana UAMH 10762]EMC98721.1 hypothetical protein BAUCODRAFT_65912 [Baudoinia panamericana UAMH 10762]